MYKGDKVYFFILREQPGHNPYGMTLADGRTPEKWMNEAGLLHGSILASYCFELKLGQDDPTPGDLLDVILRLDNLSTDGSGAHDLLGSIFLEGWKAAQTS